MSKVSGRGKGDRVWDVRGRASTTEGQTCSKIIVNDYLGGREGGRTYDDESWRMIEPSEVAPRRNHLRCTRAAGPEGVRKWEGEDRVAE